MKTAKKKPLSRLQRDAIARAQEDQKYWQDFAALFGLKCYGFNWRDTAGFHDASNDAGHPVEIPGWLADRILKAMGNS